MSVLGLVSGAFGGLGALVLLQQFAVLYPTRIATIVAVVGGAVIGVGAPLLARRSGSAPAATQAAEPPTWTASPISSATHVAPVAGLQAWNEPDPEQAVARDLPGGERLCLVDQRGDWAQVETDDGWTGWVDARLLEALPS